MLFMSVEVANERKADLRRAADRDRRTRAPRAAHHAGAPEPPRHRARRSSRWGATVDAVTRGAR